jgi:multidrug resistance efflux pump
MIVQEKERAPREPAPRPVPQEPADSSWSSARAAIRYGGSPFLRWPIRIGLLVLLIGAGFLPYKYEVGGGCRVVAVQDAAIRAQLQDEIADVLVSDGDTVQAGQVIATLAAREERAQLAEAKADVDYAAANLKLLEDGPREEEITKANEMAAMWKTQVEFWTTEHERQKGLVESHAGSLSEMEKAFSSLMSAKSMLAAAKEELGKLQSGHQEATIAAARAQLAKAKAALAFQEEQAPLIEIRSSISGTISTPGVKLRTGQAVSPGDMIAVVRDVSSLKVEVLADEAAASTVEPGQAVKIRLWGLYGNLINGKVEKKEPMASEKAELTIEEFRSDRETRQEQIRFQESDDRFVRILVSLDEPNPALVPGLTGEARVVVADSCFWNALWRPIERFALVEVWSWLP